MSGLGHDVNTTLKSMPPLRPRPVSEMTILLDFPVTAKWPPLHPERLQLYSLPTPNGVKASIMLEEIGLPYEVHRVNFSTHDQFSPEFLSLNPNNKIPAIIDPQGPGSQPLALFESGAILVYLAEKTGQLLPADPADRYHTLQWLMFQMGGLGPMGGQVGFFNVFAGKDFEDKRPLRRYVEECRRMLGVLDRHLKGRQWMMDSAYTVADVAIFPWVRQLIGRYQARELIEFDRYPEVARVLDGFLQRPAVQRGLNIPSMA